MNCPACGHTLSPGARFCNKCGTLLSVSADSASVVQVGGPCPKCHHILKPGARFCTSCGAALTGLSNAATEAGRPLDIELPWVAQSTDGSTQPMNLDSMQEPLAPHRSHLDTLPLHPIKRGVPDFELPEPPKTHIASTPPTATDHVPAPVMAPEGSVSFDGMQAFAQSNTGRTFKWLAIGALALVLIGAGSYWGYRHYGAVDAPDIASQPVQPAVDNVAAGEIENPSLPGASAEVADVAADAAARAGAAPDESATIRDAAVPELPRPTPAFVEVSQAGRGDRSAAPVSTAADTVMPPSAEAPAARQVRRKSNAQNLDSLLD